MADTLTEEYYTEEAKGSRRAMTAPPADSAFPTKDRFNAVRDFNVQKSQKLEAIIADGRRRGRGPEVPDRHRQAE